MELLRSTKSKINKDKERENVPQLEITEVVLVRCNIVSNDCQQGSRVLYTFVPNKSFGYLLVLYLQKLLIHNFHILKYGLLIKILK